MFEMKDIPEGFQQEKLGWEVLVDGVAVAAKRVVLRSKRFGQVDYGLRPEGFDSFTYKPVASNGVTLPYCILERRVGFLLLNTERMLLVGLLEENRLNMGGKRYCVIGGFTEPGENLETARHREASEEAGIEGKVLPIGGEMVTDRLFWDVSNGVGGVYPHAQKINPDHLVEFEPGKWRLRENIPIMRDYPKSKALVFFEWGETLDATRDGIAQSALAHLINAYNRNKL